ncbi:hypothetical protein [Brevibacterium casei]
MAPTRRLPTPPIGRLPRPAAKPRTTQESSAPVLLSRQIVDSEPQKVSVSTSFAEALASCASDGPSQPGTITQVIVPHSTPELLAEIATT